MVWVHRRIVYESRGLAKDVRVNTAHKNRFRYLRPASAKDTRYRTYSWKERQRTKDLLEPVLGPASTPAFHKQTDPSTLCASRDRWFGVTGVQSV